MKKEGSWSFQEEIRQAKELLMKYPEKHIRLLIEKDKASNSAFIVLEINRKNSRIYKSFAIKKRGAIKAFEMAKQEKTNWMLS